MDGLYLRANAFSFWRKTIFQKQWNRRHLEVSSTPNPQGWQPRGFLKLYLEKVKIIFGVCPDFVAGIGFWMWR
jgi:hypothetical protein